MNDSPFDFLNSINTSKKNLIREDGRSASEYTPYLMNKGLSQFPDTIMSANAMNMHHQLDKQMQYEFMLHAIRPRKRVGKWAKKEDAEVAQTIADLFGCSIKRAEEIKATLGTKVVASLIEKSKKMHGGIQNAR
jgi:hypothetical protein